MKASEKENWRINIENAAAEVCRKYGTAVAVSVFERYGAHDFDDLSSADYSEVFGELYQIATDD